MTPKQEAAMQQAMEALEIMKSYGNNFGYRRNERNPYGVICEALDSLREALAEPVQEPVAWRYQDSRGNYRYRKYVAGFDVDYAILKPVPLYTAPPQRKPLTSHKDRPDQNSTFVEGYGYVHTAAVRAIEAAHGITGEST